YAGEGKKGRAEDELHRTMFEPLQGFGPVSLFRAVHEAVPVLIDPSSGSSASAHGERLGHFSNAPGGQIAAARGAHFGMAIISSVACNAPLRANTAGRLARKMAPPAAAPVQYVPESAVLSKLNGAPRRDDRV